jgi:uncharacterized protein (DUF2062 family)
LGKWLQNPDLALSIDAPSAGAAFIGLFVSFLPISHAHAARGRAGGRDAMQPAARGGHGLGQQSADDGPMYFFAYNIGTWLMDSPPMVTEVHIDFAWLTKEFERIWRPLLLGSLVCGMGQRDNCARDRAGRLAHARRTAVAGAKRQRHARAAANAPSRER